MRHQKRLENDYMYSPPLTTMMKVKTEPGYLDTIHPFRTKTVGQQTKEEARSKEWQKNIIEGLHSKEVLKQAEVTQEQIVGT